MVYVFMNYIDWLNNKDLDYREGILYFANSNTLEIAEKFGVPKMDIAAACEALSIKISACQLGAFG